MALSRLQKGLLGLAMALVAVIAVGYAGMRYLENAVADAVRAWAAQTSPDARVEVGDVAYTLVDNRLVLKNVRFNAQLPDKRSAVIGVEELEVLKPGTSLLSLMRDPKAEIKEARADVAQKIVLRHVSLGPNPVLTIEERTISDIKIDSDVLNKLVASPGADPWSIVLDVAYGISFSKDASRNIKMTIAEIPLETTIREAVDQGYGEGHLKRCDVKNVAVKAKGKDVLSIADISLENMNLPPRETMDRFNEVMSREEVSDDEVSAEWLKVFFGSSRPLLGSFTMRDMRIADGPAEVTLDKLNFANPGTAPFAFSLSAEHLKMPVAFLPEMQLLSVMGLRDVDASASLSISLPAKDGAFDSSASLSVADLGTVDAAFKGVLPRDVFEKVYKMGAQGDSPETEAAVGELLDDNLRLSHMELGYADEGLLPRLGVLGEKLMGLSPDQAMQMAKQYLQEVAELSPDNPNVPKLMSFIDRPGAIRLIFAPDKPMLTGEIEQLPADSPFLTLDVTPGPKTVQEEMADLLK